MNVQLTRGLRIRDADDLRLHASRGAVFESWAISEVLKGFLHRGLDPDIWFWRDSAGHEIDLILEHRARLVPVEMKSGETFSSDFLSGLDYWRGLAGQEDLPATVVYHGTDSYLRSGTAVVSWRRWG